MQVKAMVLGLGVLGGVVVSQGCSGPPPKEDVVVGNARGALVAGLEVIEREPTSADLGEALVPAGAKTIVIFRKHELARDFPLTTGAGVKRKVRGKPWPCGDGGTLEPVILTTYTKLGQAIDWRQYPLAMDAWRCKQAGKQTLYEYPAGLTEAQIDALIAAATDAARAGEADRAEFFFRRLLHVEPNNWSLHFSLARVYLARIQREEADQNRRIIVRRDRDAQIKLLHSALATKGPEAPPVVTFELAEAYNAIGLFAKASEHYKAFLKMDGIDQRRAQRAQHMVKRLGQFE